MTRTFLNWSYLAKLLGHLYQLYTKLDRTKSTLQIMSLSSPRSSLSSLETNPLCNLYQSMIIEQQELIMSHYLFFSALARNQGRNQGRNQKRHSTNMTKPQHHTVLHKLPCLWKISCTSKKLSQHYPIAKSWIYITQSFWLSRGKEKSKSLPKDPQGNRP